LLPNPALDAADVSKDLRARPDNQVTMEMPVWTVTTATTDNTVATARSYALPFLKSRASSAHPDPQAHKANQETRDPADRKERTARTEKMEISAHKAWSVPLEIKDPLDHPDFQDQRESPDVSTKSMAPLDLMDPPDHPAVLDQKVFLAPMVFLAPQALKDQSARVVLLVERANLDLPVNPVEMDPLEMLERATIVPSPVHLQAIRHHHQKHRTPSKTLILGAIFLQETVLLFNNAQFVCFIFFVRWNTTR